MCVVCARVCVWQREREFEWGYNVNPCHLSDPDQMSQQWFFCVREGHGQSLLRMLCSGTSVLSCLLYHYEHFSIDVLPVAEVHLLHKVNFNINFISEVPVWVTEKERERKQYLISSHFGENILVLSYTEAVQLLNWVLLRWRGTSKGDSNTTATLVYGRVREREISLQTRTSVKGKYNKTIKGMYSKIV